MADIRNPVRRRWVVGYRLRHPRLPLYSRFDQGCWWLTGRPGSRYRWTNRPERAARFSRREDAELAAAGLLFAQLLCLRENS